MAKLFLGFALEFIIGLLLLTQVIIPIFVKNLKFFWLFRSSDTGTASTVSTLDELNQRATSNKEEREKIKENLSSASEQLREIESKTN